MKVGFALRSSVFTPREIGELVPVLDAAGVDSVWFPSVRGNFDAMDMCGIALGRSTRLRAGPGVVRAAEQDPAALAARISTLDGASGGRFVLGIGTGRGTGRDAVEGLLGTVRKTRSELRGGKAQVYFAALRKGMLRAAYREAQGAIMNFCPPDYVARVAPRFERPKGFELACYVKLFFAEEEAEARRMLAKEFKMYDGIPQYHSMFEQAGWAGHIAELDPAASAVPEELLAVSAANPGVEEVRAIAGRFREAGVDLPIVYPYVSGDEEYRAQVVKTLSSVG